MDSARSKTLTGSGVATRSQARFREVTMTLPGPLVGKYWRTASTSSALSKTSSQSLNGVPLRSASSTAGTAVLAVGAPTRSWPAGVTPSWAARLPSAARIRLSRSAGIQQITL